MTESDNESAALVLFSGGQDSATCLAWALARFDRVETIGFDYGQRHAVEMECRVPVRDSVAGLEPAWQDRLGDDHLIDLGVLGEISETALTRASEIEISRNGLPNTFVPARNLMFLLFTGALAYRRGIHHLVGGMCETDYSGYPDCRDESIKAMNLAMNLGIGTEYSIHTPLMRLDKAGTWRLAESLGGQPLVDIIVEKTHTCYLGVREDRHDWGYGCGSCPACELRKNGWETFAG